MLMQKTKVRYDLIGIGLIICFILISLASVSVYVSFVGRPDNPDEAKNDIEVSVHADGTDVTGEGGKYEEVFRIVQNPASRYIISGQDEMYVYLEMTALERNNLSVDASDTPLVTSIVVDTSGSMSGEKLRNVKAALRSSADIFEENDLVQLVQFNNGSSVEYQSTKSFDRAEYLQAIDRLEADGGTNMHAGYADAIAFLQTIEAPDDSYRSMILLSDGKLNQGITDPNSFIPEANPVKEEQYYINSISTVGVGIDFDESIMTHISKAWDGNYYFIDNPSETSAELTEQYQNLNRIVVRDIEIKFDGTNNIRLAEVIGYDSSDGRFSPNDLYENKNSAFILKLDTSKLDIPKGETRVELGEIEFSAQILSVNGDFVVIEDENSVYVDVSDGNKNALFSDDKSYQLYIDTFTADLRWEAYEALDAGENRQAEELFEKALNYYSEASKRLGAGMYEEEMSEIVDILAYINTLGDDGYINDLSEGRLLQKSNQSGSYDKNYSR